MRLLVVDDNEDARVLQTSIMASQGYEVATAENGVDALNSIKQSKPDLIITDILMPVMDGYEFCRKVKSDDELKDIPFVFYSAHYLDARDKEMAANLGVTHFIQKPMENAEFIRVIRDIILEAQSPVTGSAASPAKADAELKQEHEQRLTEMLYGKLGELEESQKMLRAALKGTIEAVALAIEVRDPSTSGHQHRVARLAEAIALEMGLNAEQAEGIRMGAGIHDIGKIQIPAEILAKPGRLSDIEFSIVREHPKVGYGILKKVEFPWPVADIAHQHHERMEGSGYPQGLKGEAICPEARIVAVADVVEAMSSHRPHRPALGIDAALEEISANRGTLFDAQAVDACLRLFRDKGFDLAKT